MEVHLLPLIALQCEIIGNEAVLKKSLVMVLADWVLPAQRDAGQENKEGVETYTFRTVSLIP